MTVVTAIEELLRRAELDPSLPLGAGGLGLDSIAIAELLLACEERFGITIAAELLAGEPLTVGRLAERVENERAARGRL
jgi:acyl carrier protein